MWGLFQPEEDQLLLSRGVAGWGGAQSAQACKRTPGTNMRQVQGSASPGRAAACRLVVGWGSGPHHARPSGPPWNARGERRMSLGQGFSGSRPVTFPAANHSPA